MDLLSSDGKNKPEVRSISNAEWSRAADRSVLHSTAPLLYQRLNRKDSLDYSVPASLMGRLFDIQFDVTTRNLRLFHQLGRRLAVLASGGIPVVVLKGAHLGECVYRNITLRPMADADILLRKKDIPNALRLLGKSGFSIHDRQLLLDIHWNLTHSITELNIDPIVQEITEKIDIDAVWERSVFTEIAGVRARVLCPEDLLLHLCIHLSVFHLYQFGQVKALCDIHHTVLRFQEAFDWPAFLDRADKWGVSNAVHLTLIIAHELLGTPFPAPALERMRPAAEEPGKLAWAVERIFTEEARGPEVSPKFWHLVGRGPIKEKFRALRNLLWPSVDMLPARSLQVSGASKRLSTHYRRLRSQSISYGRLALKLLLRDPDLVSTAAAERQNLKMKRWLSSSPESGPPRRFRPRRRRSGRPPG